MADDIPTKHEQFVRSVIALAEEYGMTRIVLNFWDGPNPRSTSVLGMMNALWNSEERRIVMTLPGRQHELKP